MFNRLYDKFKKLIKENYKFGLFLICLYVFMTFKLPYYIECPGGILDISKKVNVENAYQINGSFNLAYVTSFKATIPTLMYASINKNWDVLKDEDALMQDTQDEVDCRNHILLQEANENAIIVAFNKTQKYVEVTNRKVMVIYVDSNSQTDLQIGDQIIEVNGIKINDKNELMNILDGLDSKISFKVLNNGEHVRYAEKIDISGKKMVGIILSELKDIDTSIDVKFNFNKSESGPSGGLIMSLSIYNYLVEEDITHGLKIVGTGTIDEEGNVGSIGGIQYKIKGAAKKKADLFFVPKDNYDEALEVVNKNKLKIKLVMVNHIDDALNYLNKNY